MVVRMQRLDKSWNDKLIKPINENAKAAKAKKAWKKAEAHKPVIMLFGLAIAVITLFFAYSSINRLKETKLQAETASFTSSLQSSVDTLLRSTNYGSSNIRRFQVPTAVSTVCFGDSAKPFNKFVSADLVKRATNGTEGSFMALEVNNRNSKSNYLMLPFSHLELDSNPICISTKSGALNAKILTRKRGADIIPLDSNDAVPECIVVLYNGAEQKSIDIVFIGQNYENNNKFSEDAAEYVFKFTKSEPFASRIDSFNFYIANPETQIDCLKNGILQCDQYSVKKTASKCPNDFVFVLYSRSKAQNLLDPLRSSASGNMASINTAEGPNVALHEFGHLFADLADEYVDEAFYGSTHLDPLQFPNCDAGQCSKWNSINGSGCFRGCMFSSYFRPTEISVMRAPQKTSEFGPVNSAEISNRIDIYSG